ncbi:MAG: XamI family restriction endonuclease [Acidimicrobiia bacterium]|nr:XamI family restriction endonuclease [Acidimicrobiia bacterium]MYD04545.1 XamI family restriction endonuclease [Acidimicrobiia bacterium]
MSGWLPGRKRTPLARCNSGKHPQSFQHPYGLDLRYVLLLGGYFNERYLGYNASEGIDWIWEHRIEDLIKAGL